MNGNASYYGLQARLQTDTTLCPECEIQMIEYCIEVKFWLSTYKKKFN